jgi:hypothetical protein
MYDDELALSDQVLFEIPVGADVDRFRARLRLRWSGWSRRDEDVWLVGAEVKADESDLADVLRQAQELLPDLGLPAIRFCVDNRVYDLRAPCVELVPVVAKKASPRPRRKPAAP